MQFCLITDKPDFAREAESAGVERIMIDLERNGKAERQAGRNLFISDHRLASVSELQNVLKHAALVVRVNPLAPASAAELDAVLNAKPAFVMLPYFRRLDEVREFLRLVRGRAKTILLVETKEAAHCLPEILQTPGVAEIHLGLNDLSLSLGHQVIFETLCNGMIEQLATLLNNANMPFGFGGIARLSNRELPVDPAKLLAEQVRLRASVGWLGRSFRGELERQRRPGELSTELECLRAAIHQFSQLPPAALVQNKISLCQEIQQWKASLKTQLPN